MEATKTSSARLKTPKGGDLVRVRFSAPAFCVIVPRVCSKHVKNTPSITQPGTRFEQKSGLAPALYVVV